MKRTKQKNIRLTAREDQQLQREARRAGVTDSEWLRLIVRAALGETALLEQMSRVVPSSRKRKSKR